MTGRGTYRGTQEKRARIVQAALEEFAAGGYEAASLRSIAAAAGMSHPGLLHHFPTKQSLLEAVLTAHEEADRAAVDHLLVPGTADELVQGLAVALEVDLRATTLVRLRARLVAAGSDPQHPAHDYIVRRARRHAEELTGHIGRLQQAGQVDGTVPAPRLAAVLLALMDGLVAHRLSDPDLDAPGLVREAARRLLGGHATAVDTP